MDEKRKGRSRWKAEYGGMEMGEAEEVKHRRDENAWLKKLVE